jgi:hypothetical protein
MPQAPARSRQGPCQGKSGLLSMLKALTDSHLEFVKFPIHSWNCVSFCELSVRMYVHSLVEAP